MAHFPTATGKQIPYIILIITILLSTIVFYALQHYRGLEAKKPSNTFYGVCVDTPEPSFFRALYFITTLYSAIGYGDVVPCTWIGKILTIIFASMGVPLALLCVTKFGKQMAKWFDTLSKKLANQQFDIEEISQIDVPTWRICIAIAVTIVWIFISSLVFYGMIIAQDVVLDGNYLDALYFTIVTFLTIGFGDYFPYIRPESVIVFIIIMTIGLSLMSMCIAMIQTRMQSRFDKMIEQIKRMYMYLEMENVDNEQKNELMAKKILEVLTQANDKDTWAKPTAKAVMVAAKKWKRKTNRNVAIQTETVI